MAEHVPISVPMTPESAGGHPERHEPSRVSVRALAIVAGVVIAVTVIVQIGMYIVFGIYSRDQAARPVNRPQTAIRGQVAAPPSGVPRLQGIPGFHGPTPRQDMDALRAANEAILGSYGPGDAPGYVRIPVERAMQLALERGMFPVQGQGGQEEGGGDEAP